jgi:F-type H+-transporting ATPase subunit b
MAETTHEGTEQPEGHSGAFPPFESSTFASQVLWLAIAFGLLYWLMSRIALPRVAGILEGRASRIASDVKAAQAMKADSDAAVAAYEAALAAARNRAHTIASETRDKVAGETETTRKGLEAELSVKLAAAEESIAKTKAAALGNVRTIAVDAAGAIVEKLTGRPAEQGSVDQAVDAAIRS